MPTWLRGPAVRAHQAAQAETGRYTVHHVAHSERGRLVRVQEGADFSYVLAQHDAADNPNHITPIAHVLPSANRLWLHEELHPRIDQHYAGTLGDDHHAWDGEMAGWMRGAARANRYRVLKADTERRYTLGIAYPASALDAHGDFTTQDDLEHAAWEYNQRGGNQRIGIQHRRGTDGAGVVVESYIYRGPVWNPTDDPAQEVHPGDWLMGVVWEPTAWSDIKTGRMTGFSWQGMAKRNRAGREQTAKLRPFPGRPPEAR